jgi:hypothetical protein
MKKKPEQVEKILADWLDDISNVDGDNTIAPEFIEEIKDLIAKGTIGNRRTLQRVIELWVQK